MTTSSQDAHPVRKDAHLPDALRELGRRQTRLQALRLARAKREAAIAERYGADIAEAEASLRAQHEAIVAYVDRHRDRLFCEGPTLLIDGGEISLRALPLTVDVADSRALAQALYEAGEHELVRVRPELDMAAIKKLRPDLGDAVIYRDERVQLVIVPATSGERIAAEL